MANTRRKTSSAPQSAEPKIVTGSQPDIPEDLAGDRDEIVTRLGKGEALYAIYVDIRRRRRAPVAARKEE